MTSVCKYFNQKQAFTLPFDGSDFAIMASLNQYRKWFLKRKNVNTDTGHSKDTPIELKRLFDSFHRKIKGKPLFKNDSIRTEYLTGIDVIFSKWYELKAKENRPSKFDKRINQLADCYILKKKCSIN